ncbi:MAG: histidine kinase dimerization/phospho-acceptor domain-containing protein, partial [Ktedonobacteraceae bacterium]
MMNNAFDVLALSSILVAISITYRQSSSQRERQQLRLFVSGIILAVAPLLFLTVLPRALNLPSQYVIDSQLSTVTLVLLPLILGYTILRYQFLVFDMHVRRAVAWIVGVVGLIILGYVVVTLSSLLFSKNALAFTICLIVLMGLLAPCVWWFARVITERLFFSEIHHYRRLIEHPDTDILASETLDLNEASRLLTLAVVNAFETQEVCLYVLDEDTGYYRLYPGLRDDEPDDIPRRELALRLLSNISAADPTDTDWMNVDAIIIQRMTVAKRPLLLSEASRADEALPTGLARYFRTTSSFLGGTEPILAPVRAQGKLIGLLLLGERGDQQQYAGPDFEAIYLLFSRFSPVLETARLYEKANRHAAILNTLYTGSTIDLSTFTSVEEVATAYTKVAAEAVTASAEIWLYCEKDKQLHCAAHQGTGPHLAQEETLLPAHVRDWTSWFYEGASLHARQEVMADVPPCLAQTPGFPFAWLPLQKGLQQIGVLALTYARPHLFSHEEKRILAMFAVQCADALENTRMTIELRAAYERQQELDLLKDQFIATASHELRTPLTAVQGYIELLATYDGSLTPETRADFVTKANRGCNELNLMVGNIMDASHVQIDAQNVQLSSVPLADPVQHVLEILEAMTMHENRVIEVDVAPDLYVMADHMRLRQVLMNLVSNALKYSSGGSRIEISAAGDDKEITLRIRDYGAG